MLDLLHQRAAGFVVELVALGVELLLQAFDFVVLTLELVLLGLQLLAQGLEIALAFVGGENGLLDIDRAELGSRCIGDDGSGGIAGSSARGGG